MEILHHVLKNAAVIVLTCKICFLGFSPMCPIHMVSRMNGLIRQLVFPDVMIILMTCVLFKNNTADDMGTSL